MKISVRALSLIAVLSVLGASASATVVLSFHSNGSHTVAAGIASATDTVFFDDLSTIAPASLTYTYNVTVPGGFAPSSGTGTITLVDASSISFSFSGAVIGGATGMDALAGSILSFYGGTGSLAGMIGEGQISNTIDVTDATKHRTTFEAALVPEPASMAIMALGLAGVAARRRRK